MFSVTLSFGSSILLLIMFLIIFRVKTDGKRHHKVVLAAKHKTEVADKLDVFSAAYRSLTGKDTSIVLDQ